MTESQPTLELSGVGLIRGTKRILDDVFWRVLPGENWAIVGANGSGKTSLLKIATGYLWPSAGGVSALGRRFGEVDLRILRRRIGWVSSALIDRIPPSQTAVQIVLSGPFASIGLWDDPTSRQRQAADSLLHRMGCGKIADRRFAVLSAGERQKVLIARALMAEPEILILDEACAGLDLSSRENLLETIDDLGHHTDGNTLIFVTHHIEEIPPLVSHVLVLKAGKVLAAGPKGQTLTTEVLGRAFDIPLTIDRHNGRFWARMSPTDAG